VSSWSSASPTAPCGDAGSGARPVIARLGQDELDARSLGGKGAALGRLVDEGFPVPDTIIVTVEGYHAVIEAAELRGLLDRLRSSEPVPADLVDAAFAGAPLASDVERLIVEQVRAVGAGGLVAVRSSATVEDLHGSSFAGQYRSLLDVDSSEPGEVMEAVRLVWASLWHPAPIAYRRAFDIDESDIAMAVVVMQMVPATTAGVVFTDDPGGVDGARIEAVEGLGEALVSGGRTPNAWIVPRGQVAADDDMPVAAARALEISLEVAERMGTPQDVEWAALGDDVYVVQARPITVLDDHDGLDTPIDEHELTTAGIVEMVPGVLPPLRWELNRFLLEEAFRSVLDTLGVLSGSEVEMRPFVRRVRGRAAIDFDQLLEATSRIPGAAADLEHQYFGDDDRRSDPSAADSSAGSGDDVTVREGRLSRLGREWGTIRARRRMIEQADISTRAVHALRGRRPDVAQMTGDQLLAYSRRLVDLSARALAAELGVAAAAAASYARLVGELERYLGPDEGEAAAQSVIALCGVSAERVATSSAGVFAGPTWKELGTDPPSFDRAGPEAERAAAEALRQRLKALPGWTRRRVITGQFVDVRAHMIDRVAADVIEQLRRREATKAAVLELGGEVRRIHLELGQRLVDQGRLENATDIELLTGAELERAMGDEAVAVRPDEVRRRRNWISRYESEGVLPDRFVGVPDREPAALPAGDVLDGWAASPGRYEGLARVVRGARGAFEPGEVLVAEATDASWSPLFVKAGAVVVERGGPLSHAAILARELGLPAVLNVTGATHLLDGCTVTVDGRLGAVVIGQRATTSIGSDPGERAS